LRRATRAAGTRFANGGAGVAAAAADAAARRRTVAALRPPRPPATALQETDSINPRLNRRLRVVAAILVAAVLVWWAGRSLAPRVLSIVAHIQNLGPAAPIAFIAIYACAVVALIPASLLTIAGGAVFGLIRGVIYALAGATLGSTAAFLIGRYAARRLVATRLAEMPRFQAIEQAVSARGRRIVFLLRLSPVVPFNFLNYALGLTTISVWDFVIASLGTVPGAFVYAYAGKMTGEALAFAGQAQVPRNASYYAVLVAGLVATVAATTVVTRTARRALQDV
ncbi:MAG: putative rane protein, partial [Acidobacteria bacterium]|nr:putative rane protein [Acidobacteriota bacterium]